MLCLDRYRERNTQSFSVVFTCFCCVQSGFYKASCFSHVTNLAKSCPEQVLSCFQVTQELQGFMRRRWLHSVIIYRYILYYYIYILLYNIILHYICITEDIECFIFFFLIWRFDDVSMFWTFRRFTSFFEVARHLHLTTEQKSSP